MRVFEYDRLKLGQVVDNVTFEPRDLETLRRIHADQDVYFDLIYGVRFEAMWAFFTCHD